MKLYSFTILLSLSVVFIGATVTVISQTQDELILKFEAPDYQIGHEKINGISWQTISCDEGSSFAEEGLPELRSFSESVGVPINGDISIQVSDISQTVLKNIMLKPAYKLILDKDEVDYVFYQDTRAYLNPQAYPLDIVQKGEAAFVGDRNFIPLRIFPFQYKAASQELVINTSFTIRVIINGAKTAAADWQLSENPMDGVADKFFINNATSKTWRLAKTRDSEYESPKDNNYLVNEIQLIVDREGIYKVGYSQLSGYINTMIDSLGSIMAWDIDTVDPNYLELTDENGTVPIYFSGESDNSFDPEDYFEFYGDRHYGDEGYSDDYTAENVYTLYLKNGLGARMAVENGGLIVADASKYIVPDAYEDEIHLEQQIIYDKLGNGWTAANPQYSKEDSWFWRKINAPNLDIIPFELQYPKDTTVRTASAKVVLYGLTFATGMSPSEYDHEASVRINQAMVNTHTWRGQTEKIFYNQSPIANSYFQHGTNYMYISLSGNTVSDNREQVLLDYMELKYWREYKTSQDVIKFSKPSNRPTGLYQFQIEGFTSNDISVYKLGSSIFSNCQIEPFNLDGLAPWTVTLQDSASSHAVKYFAVTGSNKLQPKEYRLNIPSDLKNPGNSAEVILVTRSDLMEAEGTNLLVSLWETDGYNVAKVDYQDIFDEFNHGIRSAESLKEFFSYAYNNWASPQLKYVLLLGEGVSDERDNSPARKYALIPIKMVWTPTLGATASDNWYACIVGTDIVPDITVARINVWEPGHVLDYANKAQKYRNDLQTQSLWNSHITLTSGGKLTDSNDIFAQQSERIRRQSIPDYYRVSRVYTRTSDSDYFGGTFNLKDAINSGTQYVQFMGHGGGRVWADYNLFNFNDVSTLNNQTYPIFLSLCCYASAFDTNGASSISEALVVRPNKGAIATMGFSGLGYVSGDEDWGLALTEALFKDDFPSLGAALRYSLARFYSASGSTISRYALIIGSVLLGDPLIKPNKPIPNIPVNSPDHVLEPGEVLQVNAQFPPDVTAARLYIQKLNEITVNVAFDLPVINGNFSATYNVPQGGSTQYTRGIVVAGYSSTDEYVGRSVFGVGRAAIMHNSTLPANPTWADSVVFIGNVFSNEEVLSAQCKYTLNYDATNVTWTTLTMQPYVAVENAYITTQKLPRQITGREVVCKYEITTASGTFESSVYSYVTRGPDLILGDIRLESTNSAQMLKVFVRNAGDAASVATDLSLYVLVQGFPQALFSVQNLAPLQVDEERWETIPLAGMTNGTVTFEARANWTSVFTEWGGTNYTNNVITLNTTFNYHSIDSGGATISSVDNNLSVEIPPGLVGPGVSSMFYINSVGARNALNQPDISTIKMRSFDSSPSTIPSNAYEVRTLDPTLADSSGTLIGPADKKLKLTFYYSATDTETQNQESSNTYKIYRWETLGNKWILQGGNLSASENKVVFEVRRLGVYAIYRNNDRIQPSIDVNVQDQEFTVGGYISGTGTISLLLSDANGIDVFENSIRLYLNGSLVPADEYVASVNLDNVNRIPIKYKLNVGRGNYTLVADCKDVNGNYTTREIQFIVNETFDIVNIGNYPNPVLGRAQDPKNDGRTRFTYVLTDAADEVAIKVYTVSGRLVKTFANLPTGVGYHEYPRTLYAWDCRDESNMELANGVYFYKVIASKGSKKLEKTMKMAILK